MSIIYPLLSTYTKQQKQNIFTYNTKIAYITKLTYWDSFHLHGGGCGSTSHHSSDNDPATASAQSKRVGIIWNHRTEGDLFHDHGIARLAGPRCLESRHGSLTNYLRLFNAEGGGVVAERVPTHRTHTHARLLYVTTDSMSTNYNQKSNTWKINHPPSPPPNIPVSDRPQTTGCC